MAKAGSVNLFIESRSIPVRALRAATGQSSGRTIGGEQQSERFSFLNRHEDASLALYTADCRHYLLIAVRQSRWYGDVELVESRAAETGEGYLCLLATDHNRNGISQRRGVGDQLICWQCGVCWTEAGSPLLPKAAFTPWPSIAARFLSPACCCPCNQKAITNRLAPPSQFRRSPSSPLWLPSKAIRRFVTKCTSNLLAEQL